MVEMEWLGEPLCLEPLIGRNMEMSIFSSLLLKCIYTKACIGEICFLWSVCSNEFGDMFKVL